VKRRVMTMMNSKGRVRVSRTDGGKGRRVGKVVTRRRMALDV
jgi:hypothetical protein